MWYVWEEARVLVGKPEGKRPFGRLRLDGRKILKCIFKKCNGGSRTGMIPLRTGTDGGL